MNEVKQHKRKLSEEKSNDEESVVEQIDVPTNVEVPPHSVKIRFVLKRLEISVHLLRTLPDKLINLNPTDIEFFLDTFKFTKKYYLRFKYPQGIKVDAEKAQAEFLYGILKVTFPIVEIIDKKTGQKVVAALFFFDNEV